MSSNDNAQAGCGLLVIVLFIIFLVVRFFGGIPTEYGSGERVGVPVKVSYKGIVCKTYEGQLNLGGMATNGQGIATPNIWQFSVIDPKIVEQINDAADKGKRVTLTYWEPLVAATCQSDSGYIVTGVKEAQ